jgi:hypothetical protein
MSFLERVGVVKLVAINSPRLQSINRRIHELQHSDKNVRLRAVEALKEEHEKLTESRKTGSQWRRGIARIQREALETKVAGQLETGRNFFSVLNAASVYAKIVPEGSLPRILSIAGRKQRLIEDTEIESKAAQTLHDIFEIEYPRILLNYPKDALVAMLGKTRGGEHTSQVQQLYLRKAIEIIDVAEERENAKQREKEQIKRMREESKHKGN